MFVIEFGAIKVVVMRNLFEIKIHSILSRFPSLFLLFQLDVLSFSKHSVNRLNEHFSWRLLLIGVIDQQRVLLFLLLFSLSLHVILSQLCDLQMDVFSLGDELLQLIICVLLWSLLGHWNLLDVRLCAGLLSNLGGKRRCLYVDFVVIDPETSRLVIPLLDQSRLLSFMGSFFNRLFVSLSRSRACLEERCISVGLSQLDLPHQICHWLQLLFAILSFRRKHNLFDFPSVSLGIDEIPWCSQLPDLILLIADKRLLLYPGVKYFRLIVIAHLRAHCPEAAYFALLMLGNWP